MSIVTYQYVLCKPKHPLADIDIMGVTTAPYGMQVRNMPKLEHSCHSTLYWWAVLLTDYLMFTAPDCSVSGTFGPGCLADCHCRGHCDVISGKCSTHCEDGWVGDDCQQGTCCLCTIFVRGITAQSYVN